MRSKAFGLTIVAVMALASHLATKALHGQSRGKSVRTESQAGSVKRHPRTAGAPVTAQSSLKAADRYYHKSSWVDITDVRADNDVPGVVKFLLNVEAWQGADQPSDISPFVAQVDFYPVDDRDGSRRLASVHSGPLRTVRGESWRKDVPLAISVPSGVYKVRAVLVGMNPEWVRHRGSAEPVQELPVHVLTTLHNFIVR